MIYKIMGNPIPLQRPRTSFVRRIVYDPQRKDKEDTITQIKLQHKKKPTYDGPLYLDITFYMQPPASMSYKKKCFLYKMPHFKKPDLSNLIKWVEDCMEQAGILANDSRIFSINAKKIYDEYPRTEFTLTREGHEKEK